MNLITQAAEKRKHAADIKKHAEAIHLLDAVLASRQWDYALELEYEASLMEKSA